MRVKYPSTTQRARLPSKPIISTQQRSNATIRSATKRIYKTLTNTDQIHEITQTSARADLHARAEPHARAELHARATISSKEREKKAEI